jgi:hypothetical protein
VLPRPLSLFLAGGWRSLIAPLSFEFSITFNNDAEERQNGKNKERRKKRSGSKHPQRKNFFREVQEKEGEKRSLWKKVWRNFSR